MRCLMSIMLSLLLVGNAAAQDQNCSGLAFDFEISYDSLRVVSGPRISRFDELFPDSFTETYRFEPRVDQTFFPGSSIVDFDTDFPNLRFAESNEFSLVRLEFDDRSLDDRLVQHRFNARNARVGLARIGDISTFNSQGDNFNTYRIRGTDPATGEDYVYEYTESRRREVPVAGTATNDRRLEVEYRTPVIDQGETGIPGLDPIPESIVAVFRLGNLSAGQTNVGVEHVCDVDIDLPGTRENVGQLDNFALELGPDGQPINLDWRIENLNVARPLLAANGPVILNNNIRLSLTGVNTTTGEPFVYRYTEATARLLPIGVPEPSSIVVLGIGMGAALTRRRRCTSIST